MGASVPAHQFQMWHDASGGRVCVQARGLPVAIRASAHRPRAERLLFLLQTLLLSVPWQPLKELQGPGELPIADSLSWRQGKWPLVPDQGAFFS